MSSKNHKDDYESRNSRKRSKNYPESRQEPMSTPPYYPGNNFYGGENYSAGSYAQAHYSSNPSWSTHVIGTAMNNVFSGNADNRWKNYQSNNFFGSSSQDQRSFIGSLPMSSYSSLSDLSYRSDPNLRNADFRSARNRSSSSHSCSSYTGSRWDWNKHRPSYANNDGHMGYEEQTDHFIRKNRRVITSREEMNYSHTIRYDERHIKKIVKKVIKKHEKEDDFDSKKRRKMPLSVIDSSSGRVSMKNSNNISEIDTSQKADSKYASTNDLKNTRINKSEKTSEENLQRNPSFLNSNLDKDVHQNSSNHCVSSAKENQITSNNNVIENDSSKNRVDLTQSVEKFSSNSIIDLTKSDENSYSKCIVDLTKSDENAFSNCQVHQPISDGSSNCKVNLAKSDENCSSNCKVDFTKTDGNNSSECNVHLAKSHENNSSNFNVDPGKSDENAYLNCKVDLTKSDDSSNYKVNPAKSDENSSSNCKVDHFKSDEKNYKSREELQSIMQLVNTSDNLFPDLTTSSISRTFNDEENIKTSHEKNNSLEYKIVGSSENHTNSNKVNEESITITSDKIDESLHIAETNNIEIEIGEERMILECDSKEVRNDCNKKKSNITVVLDEKSMSLESKSGVINECENSRNQNVPAEDYIVSDEQFTLQKENTNLERKLLNNCDKNNNKEKRKKVLVSKKRKHMSINNKYCMVVNGKSVYRAQKYYRNTKQDQSVDAELGIDEFHKEYYRTCRYCSGPRFRCRDSFGGHCMYPTHNSDHFEKNTAFNSPVENNIPLDPIRRRHHEKTLQRRNWCERQNNLPVYENCCSHRDISCCSNSLKKEIVHPMCRYNSVRQIHLNKKCYVCLQHSNIGCKEIYNTQSPFGLGDKHSFNDGQCCLDHKSIQHNSLVLKNGSKENQEEKHDPNSLEQTSNGNLFPNSNETKKSLEKMLQAALKKIIPSLKKKHISHRIKNGHRRGIFQKLKVQKKHRAPKGHKVLYRPIKEANQCEEELDNNVSVSCLEDPKHDDNNTKHSYESENLKCTMEKSNKENIKQNVEIDPVQSTKVNELADSNISEDLFDHTNKTDSLKNSGSTIRSSLINCNERSIKELYSEPDSLVTHSSETTEKNKYKNMKGSKDPNLKVSIDLSLIESKYGSTKGTKNIFLKHNKNNTFASLPQEGDSEIKFTTSQQKVTLHRSNIQKESDFSKQSLQKKIPDSSILLNDLKFLKRKSTSPLEGVAKKSHYSKEQNNHESSFRQQNFKIQNSILDSKFNESFKKNRQSLDASTMNDHYMKADANSECHRLKSILKRRSTAESGGISVINTIPQKCSTHVDWRLERKLRKSNEVMLGNDISGDIDLNDEVKDGQESKVISVHSIEYKRHLKKTGIKHVTFDDSVSDKNHSLNVVNHNYNPETESARKVKLKSTNEKMSTSFSQSKNKTDLKDEIITNKCNWGPQIFIKLGENIVLPKISTITASKITKGKQRVSRVGSIQENIQPTLNDSNRSKTNLTLEQYLQQKQNNSQTSTDIISKIDSKEIGKNYSFSSIKDFILKQSESQNTFSSPERVQESLNNQSIGKSKMTPPDDKNETVEDVKSCVSVNSDTKYTKCTSTPIVSSSLDTSKSYEESRIDSSKNSTTRTTSFEISKKAVRQSNQSLRDTSIINVEDQSKTKNSYGNVRKTNLTSKLYKKPTQKTNLSFKRTGKLYVPQKTNDQDVNVNSIECLEAENSPVHCKTLTKTSYKTPKKNSVNKGKKISNNEKYTTKLAYEQSSRGTSSTENKKISNDVVDVFTGKEKEEINHDQESSKREDDEHSRLTVSYSPQINNRKPNNTRESIKKDETYLNQERTYKSYDNSKMTSFSTEVPKNNKVIVDIKTCTSTKERDHNHGPKTTKSYINTKITTISNEVPKKITNSIHQTAKQTFSTTIKGKTNHDQEFEIKNSSGNLTKTFSTVDSRNFLKISHQTSNNKHFSMKIEKTNTNEKYKTTKSQENAKIIESFSKLPKKIKPITHNCKNISTTDKKEKNDNYLELRTEKSSKNSIVNKSLMAHPIEIIEISNKSSNNICTSNKEQMNGKLDNRKMKSLKNTKIAISPSGITKKSTKLISQLPRIGNIFIKNENVINKSEISPSDKVTIDENCSTNIQNLNCEGPSLLNIELTSSIKSQSKDTTMLKEEKTKERIVSISSKEMINSCSVQPINRDACVSYTDLMEPNIAPSDSMPTIVSKVLMDNEEAIDKIEILVDSRKQEPQVSKFKCTPIVSSNVNQTISIDTNNDVSHKPQEVEMGLEKTGANKLCEEEPGDKHQEWTEDCLSKSFKTAHESVLVKLQKTIPIESTANKKTKNNSQVVESTVSILPIPLHKQKCLTQAQLDYENQRKEELANCPLLTSVLNSAEKTPKASVGLRILTPGEIDLKFTNLDDAIEQQKTTPSENSCVNRHIDEIITQVSMSSDLEVCSDENWAHLPVNNTSSQHNRVYAPTIRQTLNYNCSLNSGPSSNLSSFDYHNALVRRSLDTNIKPSKSKTKSTKKTTLKQPLKSSHRQISECYEYNTVCTSDPITRNQLGQENSTVCEGPNFSDSFMKYLKKWNNHMDSWRTDLIKNNQQAAHIPRTHRHSTGNKYIQNQYTVPTQNNETSMWFSGQHFTPNQIACDKTDSTYFGYSKETGLLPNTSELANILHGTKTVDINRRNSYPQMKPTYQAPENQWQMSAVPNIPNSSFINRSIRASTDYSPLTSNNGNLPSNSPVRNTNYNNFHVEPIPLHQSFLNQNNNAEMLQTNISQTNQPPLNMNEINSNNYGRSISQFKPVYQNSWPEDHQVQLNKNQVFQNNNIQSLESFISPNHRTLNEGNYENVCSELPSLLSSSPIMQNLTSIYSNSLSQSQNNSHQHFVDIENRIQVDQLSYTKPHASNLLTRNFFQIDTSLQDSNGQSNQNLQYLLMAKDNTINNSPYEGNLNALYSQNNTTTLKTTPISLKEQVNVVGGESNPAKRVQYPNSTPQSGQYSSLPTVTYPNVETTGTSLPPSPRARGSLGKEAWVLKYLNSRKQSFEPTEQPTLDSSLNLTQPTVTPSNSQLLIKNSNSVLDTFCPNSLSSSRQPKETSVGKVISYSTVKELVNDSVIESHEAFSSKPGQLTNENGNNSDIRAQQAISSVKNTISESPLRASEYDCRVLLSPINVNLKSKTITTSYLKLVKSTKSDIFKSSNNEIDKEKYMEITTDDFNAQYRENQDIDLIKTDVGSFSQIIPESHSNTTNLSAPITSPTDRSEINTVPPDINSPANHSKPDTISPPANSPEKHLEPITVQPRLITSSQSTFEVRGIKAPASSNRNMSKNKFYNMYNPCFLLMSELRQCANLEERDENTLNNALHFIAGIINKLFILKVEQNWDIDSPGFRRTVKEHATSSKVSLILILSYYQDDIYKVLHDSIKHCEGYKIKEFLDVKRTLLELMWSARNIELHLSDQNELVELMARYKKLAIDAR